MFSTRMKKLIIIFFISSNFSAQGINNFLIKHICFIGLRRVKINDLYVNFSQINEKNIFDKKIIGIVIKNLFSTDQFENIYVLKNKNCLILHVKEKPIISKVFLYKSTIIKESIIQHNLEKYNIKHGHVLNCSKIYNFKKLFEKLYQNIGRYNAEIKVRIIQIDNDHVNIKIYFFDGTISKIKKINIIGNRLFTDRELISCLNLENKPINLETIYKIRYRKFKLVNSLNKIYNFYFDHGYINFNINYVNISFTPDKKDIYITIDIHEGNKYRISKKIVIGNLYRFNKEICKILYKIKFGEIYSRKKIFMLEKNIREYLDHYGYTYPKILFCLDRNTEEKTVDLYIKIDIGNRFYVRKLIFEGNKITKLETLRNAINQLEGKNLEINLVNQGKDKLNQLGFFKYISYSIKHVPNSMNQVDVIYKVVEDYTKHINFSTGIEENKKLGFQISAYQSNLFGTGKTIGFFSKKSHHQFCIESYIFNPFFLTNKISIKSKIFYKKIHNNKNEYFHSKSERSGIETIFSIPIKENHIFDFGSNYIRNISTNTIDQLVNLRNIKNNYTNDMFIFFNLQIGKIYSKYFPIYGSHSDFFLKITTPISDNKYYKFSMHNRNYFPIDKKKNWIIMNMFNLGYVDSFNKNFVPNYDSFYSEEENTIRGFHPTYFGPKISHIQETNNKLKNKINKFVHYPIGGNAVLINKIEFIFPIPFLHTEYKNYIRTSLFFDFGNIWRENWNRISSYYKNLNKVRISSGISIKWMSPIGPLAFSYAEPIKKCYTDKIEKFQFNFERIW